MKRFAFLLLAASFSYFSHAQENSIKEVKYLLNNSPVSGYGFSIGFCNMVSVDETWNDWVKTKGGKVSFINNVLGKKEAANVQFKDASDIYTVFLDKIEYTDSVQIINVFIDSKGFYLQENSSDYKIIETALTDLNYNIRKGCARADLEQATDYLVKLNEEHANLLNKKSKLNRDILLKNNTLLKVENKKNLAAEELSLLERQNIADSPNLSKKKNKVEQNYHKFNNEISKLNELIKENQLKIEQIETNIQVLDIQIENQKILVSDIENKFNQIHQ